MHLGRPFFSKRQKPQIRTQWKSVRWHGKVVRSYLQTNDSRHNWVFRAETHEEMLAWYQDIEQLVQLPNMSLSQRQTFIASHAPEDTGDHQRQSGSSSPGLDEDEADEVPYSQSHSIEEPSQRSPQRPAPPYVRIPPSPSARTQLATAVNH